MPSAAKPSARTARSAVGALCTLAFVAAAVGVAAAQPGVNDPRSSLDLGTRLAVSFGAGFVVNLLLGGALVALGPEYAARKLGEFRDDPAETVVWGLIVGVGVPIALAILAITIIGLVVAIPGVIVLAVVGIVGSAVMVGVVGSLLTGGDDPGGSEVLVGALVLALVTAIPVLGGLINWVVGLPGIGMVGHDIYRSWKGR
ncbi:hypothetical protein [Halobaculum sp. EA56]|uniref:hypothetical protein n=1 Tax=Halobaculum sp. EA56 TaxID=3421648 RepID=UPI003EBB4634